MVIGSTKLLVYDVKHLAISKVLRSWIMTWYHHYLHHPRHTYLKETIKATMFWETMNRDK